MTLTGPKVTSTFSYETNRDVLTDIQHAVGSTTVMHFAYSYDTMGRRSSRIQDGTAVGSSSYDRFDYDTRNEVQGSRRYTGTNPANYVTDPETPSLARAYTFDPIGNRLSSKDGTASARAYTPNFLNQYTGITNPAQAPTFDSDGNQTANGAGWWYDWDAENRMTVARSYQTSPSNGSQKLEFVYDYRGRRASKKLSTYNGTSWTVNSDLRFVYDGWNLIVELNALNSFNAVRKYTYGKDLSQTLQGAGGVGGLLAAEGTASFSAVMDGNGNVMGLINNSTGSVDGVFEYDAFGNVTKSIVQAPAVGASSFGFSTKYWDTETGLNYYGQRYYSPSVGRWLSRDPIEENGGVNLYGFVGNEPIRRYDLLGKKVQSSISGCGITVIVNITLYYENDTEKDKFDIGNVASRVSKSINERWNKSGGWKVGCCAVSFQANVSVDRKHTTFIGVSGDNRIEITSGVIPDRDHVEYGRLGLWSVTSDDWVFAHEAGHLMGLDDDYDETTDSNGRSISTPRQNHMFHMMGDYGAKPAQHEVEDILQRNGIECPCGSKK